jgi:hypothetical protein
MINTTEITAPVDEKSENVYVTKSKREQYSTEIRKTKVDSMLNQKRFKPSGGENDKENDYMLSLLKDKVRLIQHIKDLAQKFIEEGERKDYKALEETVVNIRKLAAAGEDPPIVEITQTGIVPHLLKYLDQSFLSRSKIQFEILWILTNLTSGSPQITKQIYSTAFLKTINPFLYHQDDEVVILTLWLIGNLSGDADAIRHALVEHGIFEELHKVTKTRAAYPQEMLVHYTWIAANLACIRPAFDKVEVIIQTMEKLMQFKDEEIVINTLWFFSHVTNTDDVTLNKIINEKMVKLFIYYLDAAYFGIITPALRSLGNVLSSTNPDHLKLALENGALAKLCILLDNRKVAIRRETTWCVSNLLATDPNIFGFVLDTPILSKLYHIIRADVSDVKVEAVHSLANAIEIGTEEQIELLCDNGLLNLFPSIFSDSCVKVVLKGIDLLMHLLEKGEKIMEIKECSVNPILIHLEDKGLIACIEELQNHKAIEVYNKINVLIDRFFTTTVVSN